jgi:hypothetical protein
MTKTSLAAAKASFVPSGDQSGSCSLPIGLLVKFVWSLPSAFMTKRSKLPVRREAKAIFVPSGDQAGCQSSAGLLDRFVWPPPPAFMTKTSQLELG